MDIWLCVVSLFSRLPLTDTLIDSLLHVHSLLDADMEGLTPQQADSLIMEYLKLPPDNDATFKAFLGAHESIKALGDARACGTNYVWRRAVTIVCDKGGPWELFEKSMQTDGQRARLERLELQLEESRRENIAKRSRGRGRGHRASETAALIEMDVEVRPLSRGKE